MEKLTLEDVATFTWSFGHVFFMETAKGNYEWSDPDYQGDNTIRPFKGTYKDWLKRRGIPFGRDKGTHTIDGYCGTEVSIKD